MPIFELCVDTLPGIAAAAINVDRIELCTALSLGGLTPSAALVAAAVASGVPVMAMIRPRAGGFDYDAAQIALMADEIDRMASLGVMGVVFGATRGAALDLSGLGTLMAQVRASGTRSGMQLKATLHRAIDLCADPLLAVDNAIALGFDHVLSSGGASTAAAGAATLAAMQARAVGRCEIIAAAAISADNVSALIQATGVTAIHASCRAKAAGTTAPDFGFGEGEPEIDPRLVAALKHAIAGN